MLKKRALSLLLAILLLTPACAALASGAGSQSDPLVSLSYAKTWGQTFLQSVLPSIHSTLRPFYEKASQAAVGSLTAAVGAEKVSLAPGESVKLSTGATVTLLTGGAKVSVASGTVVNVSVGAAAGSGKLNRFHMYVACESTAATVTASENAVLLVDGSYTKVAGKTVFTDVKPTDWFYADVYTAVEKGLINGMTATTYVPTGTLTAAQAVKLAACIHQLYHTGKVTLANAPGADWFRSYADYALQNGILTQDFADYNAVITRQQFVKVFYNALPASEYAAINTIADNAIPDTRVDDEAGAQIYAFYRAGILTGFSNTKGYAEHAFGADTPIARSEVATIVVRMLDATARKSFTIG